MARRAHPERRITGVCLEGRHRSCWNQVSLNFLVSNKRFELGNLPFRRGEPTDWDAVRRDAEAGNLSEIPSDVYVRCYNQLRRIGTDHLQPIGMERVISVFWGRTGTGKSRRAWGEAGLDGYPKDPLTKFWDGYQGQDCVVIDEFRGGISIAHVLRWFDRYPVIVEIKGGAVVLRASRIWLTSNLDPRIWYAQEDAETNEALLRRLNITHFA
nr:replication-associated protein [Cressdnaviricota sp.]